MEERKPKREIQMLQAVNAKEADVCVPCSISFCPGMRTLFTMSLVVALTEEFLPGARAQVVPSLGIPVLTNQTVQLEWTNGNAPFVLQESTFLGDLSAWHNVSQPVAQAGDRLSVKVPTLDASSFFRLGPPPLTHILETSPAEGETGVSVNRETIFHFNYALAATTVLSSSDVHADFAGHRYLTRVELSSDRKTVTLFYLEPLPGSTRVRVTFDAPGLTDEYGRPVDLDDDGLAGGVAQIEFETMSLTSVAGTAIMGTVFASEQVSGTNATDFVNRPLAGVTITVDGMEQTMRTVTDSNGFFRLNPCPAGQFFVHIDGRTVTDVAAGIRYPDLAYYPFVGKAWNAVGGRTNNIAGFMPGNTSMANSNGWIFLPLIAPGTLQPVSLTEDTTITFPQSVLASNPALAGVSLTVPANSLFSDDGTRGGRVGIAPVPPDRLPGPLPPGLEFPLVITVQTDGPLNFDKPAPICFPNLPDPVLGVPLPAGSKQELISFNHDKGVWEAVGSMTVSADGQFICTDPGVGILAPGWHGVGPNPDSPPPRQFPRENCPLSFVDSGSDESRCEELAYIRHDSNLAQLDSPDVCDIYLDSFGPMAYEQCLARYVQRHDEEMEQLEKRLELDLAGCRDCFAHQSPVSPHGIRLAGEGDLIPDQLAAITQQIVELLRPFTSTYQPIPSEIQNQVQSLRQEADQIAGGDSIGYLRTRAIALEDMLAAGARAVGLEPDDLTPDTTPPYPVLYVATGLRPGGPFTIRGVTGPFGQYSLFVPRDGTLLHVSFYDSRTKEFGLIRPNPSPNARYRLPRFDLFPLDADAPDFDHDGLPDLVEDVYGTDPTNADSDGDGIADGAEVDQGTDPLDGKPVRTGIVGTAPTPGSAVDVAADNGLLAVAEGTNGVSLFSLANPMSPLLAAQIDTAGTAQAVALSGNLLAVADGTNGLVLIDVSDPPNAYITRQIYVGGNALGVAIAGDFAYVAVSNPGVSGRLSALVRVDLTTGIVWDLLSVAGSTGLQDIAVAGDQIYLLTPSSLLVYGEIGGSLALVGQVVVTSSANARQLFVGGGLADVGQISGYSVVDVSDPASPTVIGAPPTPQLGLQVPVTTGSGLLVATTTSLGPSPQQVALFDSSQPSDVTRFLTLFDTPGDARALTIYNGLAYVADSAKGIQVINYLAYDHQGVPPAIQLNTSATNGEAEALQPFRVTANATDDVQVRNVEFYVDGVELFSDGNFPFECRFPTPALTATKTNFTFRARAIDTGGNFTWSDELTFAILPDATPPRVAATWPLGGAKMVSSVSAYFDGPLDPASVIAASFQLVSAGPDGLLDTPDDVPVTSGAAAYHSESQSMSLDFASPLPDDLYRAVVTTVITDPAGNHPAADYPFEFRVADAVFWLSPTDGLWEDPFNWSTGTVPGMNDDVFIESIPGDVTITHGSSVSAIRSLTLGERLTLVTGTIQVSEGIELHQPLTLINGTLKGGTVTEVGGGGLFFAANTIDNLDGVSVAGDLVVTNSNARVVIHNGLSLTGTVVLDNTGVIVFSGDQIFNTGQVNFAGNSGGLQIEPGTTLTLGPAMVVRGRSGTIGPSSIGTVTLVNQGLISADVAGGTITITAAQFENSGTLECRNGGSVKLQGGSGTSNTGLIDASGGGTLTFNEPWTNSATINMNEATMNLGGAFTLAGLGTINRTGGTVDVTGVLDLNGGTLALDAAKGPWQISSGTIKGGVITQNGEDVLLFAANQINTLDNTSVVGDLVLTNSNARVFIHNGLTLTGNVVLNNGGVIVFSGDQTFNTGQVIFAGNFGGLQIAPGATLTLGPAMVVRGRSGNIGPSSSGTVTLVNQGLISADVAGGTITITAAQFQNLGTLECGNGGSVTLQGGSGFGNTGLIDASGGGALTFSEPWTNGATINADGVTVNLGGMFTLAQLGAFNRTGGTVNVTGTLDLEGGTLALDAATGPWRINGGTLQNGAVTQNGDAKLIFAANAMNVLDGMTVQGDLELTNTSARALIRNGLTLNGSVILENAGGVTFAGDQTFNTGQIVFASSSGSSGALGIEPGTTLTLGPAMVLRGKTGAIGGGLFAFSGSRILINQGLIAADVPGGILSIAPTQLENPGTLRADGAGAVLQVRVTGFTNTGTIEELNGGQVQISP